MNSASRDRRLICFSTKLGWIGILHQYQLIQRIKIGLPNRAALLPAFADEEVGPESRLVAFEKEWRDLFQAYGKGQSIEFNSLPIDTSFMTPFQTAVTKFCRKIKYGQTKSYQQLAQAAGSPRSARAVGTVMRKNLYPIVVPCHRVTASSGIGGYSASDGVSTKRRLLKLEGVAM